MPFARRALPPVLLSCVLLSGCSSVQLGTSTSSESSSPVARAPGTSASAGADGSSPNSPRCRARHARCRPSPSLPVRHLRRRMGPPGTPVAHPGLPDQDRRSRGEVAAAGDRRRHPLHRRQRREVAGPARGFSPVGDGLRVLLAMEPGRGRHLHPRPAPPEDPYRQGPLPAPGDPDRRLPVDQGRLHRDISPWTRSVCP